MNTNISFSEVTVKCFEEKIVNFYKAIRFDETEKFIVRASKDDRQIVLEGSVDFGGLALTECFFAKPNGESAGDYLPTGKRHSDGIAYLRELGANGYDIFCYPNHLSGGLGNRHSTRLTAIFYEIDDLPLDAQWSKLYELVGDTGLIPAAVVFSGGKSLHTYFATENLTQEQWLTLNRLLTIRQISDPAICNVGRAMRLPGVPRVKNGETREVALQELNLDAPRYTYAELFTALGGDQLPYELDDDRWRAWRRAKSPAEKYQALHAAPPSPITPLPRADLAGVSGRVSIFDLIPSSLILSEGQGNRNNRAFTVATHALATESWALGVSGIYLDGDARQVFDSFCQSCNPPLPTREAEKVWKSASKAYKALDGNAIAIKERIVAKSLHVPTGLRVPTVPSSRTNKQRVAPTHPYSALLKSSGKHIDSQTKISGLYAIRAGFGAGKTHLLESLTANSEDADNLLIGSRVTLIRQTTKRCKATSYQDIPSGRPITAACVSSGTLAICVNSLLRLIADQSDGEFKNIWLDETVGVLSSMMFDSTLGDDRMAIIKKFEVLLKGCKSVLLMDANISDAEVKLISALAPHLPVTQHQHDFTDRQPITIKVSSGIDGEGRYRRDAWKNQLATIYGAIADGKRVAVVGDSSDRLHAIAEDLADILGEELDNGHSPSIRLISGNTSGEQWAHDFIEDPDAHLDGVRVVLLSPAAVSGVSIMSHFDVQVGIFSGIPISASDISQMIGRFRNVGEREVLIPDFVDGTEYPAYDADAEKRRMLQRWEDEAARVHGDSVTDINPAWIDYAAYREWLNKSEKHQLADAVAGYLRNSGYEPELIPCDAEVGDAELERIRELKENIKLREAGAVAKAVPITHKEYEALKGGNATIENQRRMRRYEFEKAYPGLPVTPELAYVYLYERVSEAITIAALLALPRDGARPVAARDYLRSSRERRKGFPWLTSHTSARFDVIRKLVSELTVAGEVTTEDLSLEGTEVKRHQKYLGLSIGGLSNTQAVNTVLGCGGYALKLARRTNSARYYVLTSKPPISPELWEPMLTATIRRITERLAKGETEKESTEAPSQVLTPDGTTPPTMEVTALDNTVMAEPTKSVSPPPYIDLNRDADTKLKQIPPVDAIITTQFNDVVALWQLGERVNAVDALGAIRAQARKAGTQSLHCQIFESLPSAVREIVLAVREATFDIWGIPHVPSETRINT